MPALRPVAADARLTLVEHLGELRTRLFTCIAIVVVAFAFTYWQNNGILEIVNEPLTNSQPTNVECDQSVDPIRTSECFDRALAQAFGALRPLVADLPADGAAERRQVAEALEAMDRAIAQTPETADRRPVTLGVAEPFFQTVTVALYAAIVLTLPLLLYQLYAFLIPAFTRRERRAIVPLLLGVPVLFYTGVLFGYFFALPRAVDFLQNFNSSQFDILVQARDYYKFVLLFLAGTGLVFQVPVVVIGVSRMGIIKAAQMRKQRGLVAVGAAVISAIITPTPDVVTMLMVMVPFLVLFEASVAVAAVLERRAVSRWNDDDDEDDDGLGVPPDDPEPDPGPDPAPGDAIVPVDDDVRPPRGAGHAAELPLADDWVEETWDEDTAPDPPPGEAPDPHLLGDPDGPRVAEVAEDADVAADAGGSEDPPASPASPAPPAPAEPAEIPAWAPDAPDDDWLARADEMDDDDPFAGDPDPEPDAER